MGAISTCPDEPALLPIALGDPAVGAVQDHLDTCPACRGRVERLRAELSALQLDLDGEADTPSTEPDPAIDRTGKPAGGTTTVSIGPEAVAAARAIAEGRSGSEV